MPRRRPLLPETPPLSPLPPRPAALPTLWRATAALVVLAYVGLTLGHIYTTPLPDLSPAAPTANFINAPDERAHLEYVRTLAEHGRLPFQGEGYEWHQPPLYYSLAVPFYEAGPRAVRWLSMLLGLAGLGLLYRSARRLFPNAPPVAVFAMGFAALLPMRQAITGTVGNDVLIEVTFSWTLMVLIDCFLNGFTPRRAAYLGLALGAALLTKATGILLVPIVLVAFVFLWRCGETPRAVATGAVVCLMVGSALSVGWYARNLRLYGEITPVQAFMREFAGTSKAGDWIGRRAVSADPWTGELKSGPIMTRAGYLALIANWTFRTFFSAYTPAGRMAQFGIPVFMPPPFYLVYGLFALAALAGLLKLHARRKVDFTDVQRSFIGLLFLTILLVAGSFVAFVWTFFQAQGRYLYPAMLPLAVLGSLGLRAVLPERFRDTAMAAMLGVFFLLTVAFLFAGVIPAYTANPPG